MSKEQELREQQAEVLLILSRATMVMAHTLPPCDVRTSLEEYSRDAASWGSDLLRPGDPPLRAVG